MAQLKSVTPASGPQALSTVTNWIESAWTDIRIELHNGTDWQSLISDAETEAPTAARVQFMAKEKEDGPLTTIHETMIIIPGGMKVRSMKYEG